MTPNPLDPSELANIAHMLLDIRDRLVLSSDDARVIQDAVDYLRALADALDRIARTHAMIAPAESERGINWQPIETAPKDNKRPLLLASFDDRGVLSNVDFNGSWECESESWEMPQEYYFWDSANGMADEPTHWTYQPEGFAQLTKETAVPQAEPIDLDAVAMQQMRQAAAESTWMPAEYSGSDWISDVCRWLRDGPPQAEPKREPLHELPPLPDYLSPGTVREYARAVERAAYERAAQECLATAAELRRCADGCTDGRYDWKADGAADCADAISALGRQ